MTDKFERSKNIVQAAIDQYHPKIIVALVSGGNDSLSAYYTAKKIGIPIDYIVHVNTRTGIPETEEFVTRWALSTGEKYLVGDAGDAYERYLNRKGFFGKGQRAHTYAYHVLKAQPLRRVISSIRNRRKNFPVLMLTGIRLDESDNRKYNFANRTTSPDPAAKHNIFCNLIEHFTGEDCRELLTEVEAPKNPVSQCLHRSGECMCGTMQTKEDRTLASIFYPHWATWLNGLEQRIKDKHGWGWNDNMPKSIQQIRAGQLSFDFSEFQLCRHCLAQEIEND